MDHLLIAGILPSSNSTCLRKFFDFGMAEAGSQPPTVPATPEELGQQLAAPVEPVPLEETLATPGEDDVCMGDGSIEGSQLCSKCNQALTAENLAAQKFKAEKLMCKACRSVSDTLKRHLEDMPTEFDLMSKTSQMTFWKECSEHKQGEDCAFKYKAIRAVLAKALYTQIETRNSVKLDAEFRPLSYWEKLGYWTEDIEANGQSNLCPVVGLTYAVPILKNLRLISARRWRRASCAASET